MSDARGDICFALDAHTHVYPCHDSALAIRTLCRRLRALTPNEPNVVRVACLAESADCSWFEQLAAPGTKNLPAGFAAHPTDNPAGLWLETSEGSFLLLAGRQVITAERLEALALVVHSSIPDGLSARETIARVGDAGGVAVLSWAPGKWFFKRGKAVRSLLEELPANAFLLGDTSLRPLGWGEPRLMRLARQRGFRVVAGSDSLPFAGEEKWLGGYGCTVRAHYDSNRPVASLRNALVSAECSLRIAGRRCAPWTVARRLAAHSAARSGVKRGSGQT